MSIKEMLQDLGLLRIAVRQISGRLGYDKALNQSLVKVVWRLVMNKAVVNNNSDNLFAPLPITPELGPHTNTIELEVYSKQILIVN